MTQDSAFKLRLETEAVKKLMDSLAIQGVNDDETLVADAIEGETNIHEAISSVIDAMDNEDVLIVGGEAKIEELQARVSAAKARNETRRAAIEQAMMIADIEKINLPSATVFISKRKPKLIINDEAQIPSKFFVAQERPAPKLDKKGLLKAIEDGEAVTGAQLDNGSVSLTLRRK